MISGLLQFFYLGVSIFFFINFTVDKRIIRWLSFWLCGGILLVHGVYLIQRSLQAGHPPLTNMYETLHLLAFLVTLSYFLVRFHWEMDLVGGFAALISSLLLASSALASPEIEPLLPALKSNWLLFHVTTCFISYSAFALAMGTAVTYLIVSLLKRPRISSQNKKMMLQKLDDMTHRLILFGYPFLTMGIVTGSVWAELSWGRYWNWDPKETWALATWLIYGAYIHLRGIKNISPRRTAVVAILGFAIVIFTYYGVNFWLATLHQYA